MEKNKYKEERFELVFKKNGGIIVQRFFYIPNYNKDVLNSMEIKDLMDQIMGMNNGDFGELGMIPNSFKMHNMRLMWNSFDAFYEQKEGHISDWDLFKYEDTFTFEVKVDKRVVGESSFSGNYFPFELRESVNIKHILPDIITEIINYMSLNEYTPAEQVLA